MQRCVYLGFFDRPVPAKDTTPAEQLSKFGGKPVWIDDLVPQKYPFFCGKCKSQLYFFCQVSTPVPAARRCLYVFGCKRAKCCETSGGWVVLRATVKEDVSLKREECNDLNAHDAELTSEERSYCERVTGKRCGNGAFEEFMPPAYISIEEEPDEYCHRDAMTIRAEELEIDYRKREKDGTIDSEEYEDSRHFGGQGAFGSEQYEGSSDKAFRRFQKRLLRYPQQAIRYSFEGTPLLLGEVGHRTPQRCPHCGSERVFELQLMPNAAHELQRRCRLKDKREVLLHWTTVVVFTCKNDCVPPDTYTTEHVFVQEGL